MTVFVKNDTTTTPLAQPAPSVSVTATPTVQPTNSVEASRRLAAQNGIKRAPKGLSVPLLPDSGVADHPIGLMLLIGGAALGLWVRRAARA